MYELVIVELHEMAKWKRTTMDGTRSFTIFYPFFVAAGALHPPDVAKWSLEKDLLEGLLSDQFLRHTSDKQAGARGGGGRKPPCSCFFRSGDVLARTFHAGRRSFLKGV